MGTCLLFVRAGPFSVNHIYEVEVYGKTLALISSAICAFTMAIAWMPARRLKNAHIGRHGGNSPRVLDESLSRRLRNGANELFNVLDGLCCCGGDNCNYRLAQA